MSRPTKQPGDRRTEAIACRLTAAERLQVALAAKRAGLSVSEYLRRQALAGRVIVRESRTLDHAAFDQIRRLGINLNQLTRLAHRKGEIPVEIARAAAAVERVLVREIERESTHALKPRELSANPTETDGSEGRG